MLIAPDSVTLGLGVCVVGTLLLNLEACSALVLSWLSLELEDKSTIVDGCDEGLEIALPGSCEPVGVDFGPIKLSAALGAGVRGGASLD